MPPPHAAPREPNLEPRQAMPALFHTGWKEPTRARRTSTPRNRPHARILKHTAFIKEVDSLRETRASSGRSNGGTRSPVSPVRQSGSFWNWYDWTRSVWSRRFAGLTAAFQVAQSLPTGSEGWGKAGLRGGPTPRNSGVGVFATPVLDQQSEREQRDEGRVAGRLRHGGDCVAGVTEAVVRWATGAEC